MTEKIDYGGMDQKYYQRWKNMVFATILENAHHFLNKYVYHRS